MDDLKQKMLDLANGLENRGLPIPEFAKVVAAEGIRFASATRLKEALRDANTIPLRDGVVDQVWALWLEIETMIFEYLPFPLDVSNGERVHASLQIFRGLQALSNGCKETREILER